MANIAEVILQLKDRASEGLNKVNKQVDQLDKNLNEVDKNKSLDHLNQKSKELYESLDRVGSGFRAAGGVLSQFITAPILGALGGFVALSIQTTEQGKALKEQWDKTVESFKAVSQEFGAILLPMLQRGLEVIQRLVDWLGSLTDGQRKLLVTLALITAAVGPLLVGFGQALDVVVQLDRAFTEFPGIMDKAGKAVSRFTGRLKSASPILLAIAAAVAAFTIAYKTNFLGIGDATDKAIAFIKDKFDWLKAILETVIHNFGVVKSSIANIFQGIGQIIAGLPDLMLGYAKKGVIGYIGVYEGLGKAIASIFVSMSNKVIDVINGMLDKINNISKHLRIPPIPEIARIKNNFGGLNDILGELNNKISNAGSDSIQSGLKKISDGASTAADGAGKLATAVSDQKTKMDLADTSAATMADTQSTLATSTDSATTSVNNQADALSNLGAAIEGVNEKAKLAGYLQGALGTPQGPASANDVNMSNMEQWYAQKRQLEAMRSNLQGGPNSTPGSLQDYYLNQLQSQEQKLYKWRSDHETKLHNLKMMNQQKWLDALNKGEQAQYDYQAKELAKQRAALDYILKLNATSAFGGSTYGSRESGQGLGSGAAAPEAPNAYQRAHIDQLHNMLPSLSPAESFSTQLSNLSAMGRNASNAQNSWNIIKDKASGFFQWVKGAATDAAKRVVGSLNSMAKEVVNSDSWGKVNDFESQMANLSAQGRDQIQRNAEAAKKANQNYIDSLSNLKDKLSTASSAVIDLFSALGAPDSAIKGLQELTSAADDALTGLQDIATGNWIGAIAAGIHMVISLVQGLADLFTPQWVKIARDLRKTINQGIASGIASALTDYLSGNTSLAEFHKALRRNVYQAVLNGVVQAIVQKAIIEGALKDTLNTISNMAAQGNWKGVQNAMSGLGKQVNNVIDNMNPAIQALGDEFRGILGQANDVNNQTQQQQQSLAQYGDFVSQTVSIPLYDASVSFKASVQTFGDYVDTLVNDGILVTVTQGDNTGSNLPSQPA